MVFLFLGLNLNNIYGTNSFLFNVKEVGEMEFAMGKWIPILTMTIEPSESDGEDDVYTEAPCIKLFSDIEDVTIYYSFEGEEGETEGEIEEDVCLYPPEGESEFRAWAVNNENEDWVSDEIEEDFKVAWEVNEGDVVINELMWMGSFMDSDDEWIELRNMTNREIDLSNWNIKYGGTGKNGHIEIPHGYSIKAKGYFLITAQKYDKTEINLDKDLAKDEGYTHVSGMSLKNEGEKLILEDKKKNVIDEIWKDERWPDGWHGIFLHMSMERDSEPADGRNSSSWHTCISLKCNDEDYWRNEGFNFGTPGKENSSKVELPELGCDDFEEKILKEGERDNNLFGETYRKNFSKEEPPKGNSPKEDNPQEESSTGESLVNKGKEEQNNQTPLLEDSLKETEAEMEESSENQNK